MANWGKSVQTTYGHYNQLVRALEALDPMIKKDLDILNS